MSSRTAPLKPVPIGHLYKTQCDQPDCGGSCFVCNLGYCVLCGGYEGGLPTECPKALMSYDVQEAVYKSGLDFVDGTWAVYPKGWFARE